MKKDISQRLLLQAFLFILCLFITLFIWINYELKHNKELFKQEDRVETMVKHLDLLNTSLTYIERNEKPYLLARGHFYSKELILGYGLAAHAMTELNTYSKDPGFPYEDLLKIDSLLKEKRLFADTLIRLSVTGNPESAVNLLVSSTKDSSLIFGLLEHYKNVFNYCIQTGDELNIKHERSNLRLFYAVLFTLIVTLLILIVAFWRIRNQILVNEKLINRNQLFADMINNSYDSITMMDLDFKITFLNRATERIYQIVAEHLIGKPIDEVLQTINTDGQVENKNRSLRDMGYWVGELTRKDALGNEHLSYTNVNSFRNEKGEVIGYFSISSDITEVSRSRKALQVMADELSKSNAMLELKVLEQTKMIREVFERLEDVFIGLDDQFMITYANSKVVDLFDYTLSDIYTTSFISSLFKITDKGNVQLLHDALKDQMIRTFEFTHPINWRDYSVTIYPSPKGMSIYFRDITKEKKASLQVKQTSHLYEFISKTNDLILYAKKPTDLYQGICNIAIGSDRFILATMAFPDHETDRLIVYAKAGKDDGYLDVAQIIVTEKNPAGRGPAGRAFRTEKPYYCNDIAHDPIMLPWREEALKRGYLSSIALPIFINKNVVAIFSLYSHEVNSFTREEIELLTRVSENIGFALDVYEKESERERAQKELQKVLQAVEQSSAFIVITDKTGSIEYVNKAFLDITGYSSEEVIGENPRILKSGLTPRTTYEDLWKNLNGNKEWKGIFCNKKKNGELFWELATISPILNASGNVMNFVAVKEDITERRHLLQEQSELVEMIENSTAYFARSNIQGNFVYLNKAFRGVLEISDNEDIYNLTHHQFTEMTSAEMEENGIALQNEGRWMGENILISKSGKKIPVLMVVVIHKNEQGEPVHMSTTAINLTEIKEKELQLLQTNKELGDLARHLQNISELEKKNIAREIHDELGQYLTAMRMGIAWIKKHLDLSKEDLEVKLTEVSDIVNETIGSFKRIHSSLHPAMLEDVGLYAALEWYISSSTKHASIKVQFHTNCEKEKFLMELGLPLYRVVQEAVTNILRYSKATEASIDLMKYPNSIELIIRDNGRGFEVDKVDSKLHHGLIGMKERVFGLNGKINIHSFIGKGTTISVKIPI